jgi:hypothetical protein
VGVRTIMKKASRTFNWGLYPDSEGSIKKKVSDFLRNNQFAKEFAFRIEESTSTTFHDWIDHIVLPEDKRSFHNPKSMLFPIIIHKKDNIDLTLKPEYLEDFFRVHTCNKNIYGEKFSQYRKLEIDQEKNYPRKQLSGA